MERKKEGSGWEGMPQRQKEETKIISQGDGTECIRPAILLLNPQLVGSCVHSLLVG